MVKTSNKVKGDSLTAQEWDNVAVEGETVVTSFGGSLGTETDSLAKAVDTASKVNLYYLDSSATSNVYVCNARSVAGVEATLKSGMVLNVVPDATNTDDVTIIYDGTTYQVLLLSGLQVPRDNFKKEGIYHLIFNGSSFELIATHLLNSVKNELRYGIEGVDFLIDNDAGIQDFMPSCSVRKRVLSRQMETVGGVEILAGNVNAKGYFNCVHVGDNQIWFAPYHNGTSFHGLVTILDCRDMSVEYINLEPLNGNLVGFKGIFFNGQHVILVPSVNSLMCYIDVGTRQISTLDLTGANTDSYVGGVSVGSTQFFAPWSGGGNESSHMAIVTNLNSTPTLTFADISNGDGDAKGFRNVSHANGKLYFSPYQNGTDYHGKCSIYDINSGTSEIIDFTSLGSDFKGYSGVCNLWDRYIIFAPSRNNNGRHGNAVILDTLDNSISGLDLTSVGVKGKGTKGCLTDGRYVYFISYSHDVGTYSGLVIIADALNNWALSVVDLEQFHTNLTGFIGGCINRDGDIVLAPEITHGNVRHGNVAILSSIQNRKNITI